MTGTPDGAKILLVDDEPANVLLMERLLQGAGYQNLVSTTDSRRVLGLFREFAPDLILLDLMMPHLDGIAVLGQLAHRDPGRRLPARARPHRRCHAGGPAQGAGGGGARLPHQAVRAVRDAAAHPEPARHPAPVPGAGGAEPLARGHGEAADRAAAAEREGRHHGLAAGGRRPRAQQPAGRPQRAGPAAVRAGGRARRSCAAP